MLRPLLLALLNGAYRASLRGAWTRFEAAARAPRAAQEARASAALARAEGTAFGRDHGLSRARSLADLRAAVPVRDFDGLAPWIERAAAGEPAVLAREPLLCFERSSGSTAASKLLPFTAAFVEEMSAATGPWLHDLLSRRPGLRRTSSYWSISPLARHAERTPGGVRIGLEDDTEYFPAPVRRLLRALLPVPPEVAKLPDLDACRHATLVYLLGDERLGMVSVWSPSFLTLLLAFARERADALADDLARGALSVPGAHLLPRPRADRARAALVRAALRAPGRPRLEAIWPRLALVSCWTDASAAALVPALRAALPAGVEVQGKGLLATEGVVSFPLLGHEGAGVAGSAGGARNTPPRTSRSEVPHSPRERAERATEGSVLAVASHLLELLPSGGGEAVLPHEAEPGGRYEPVLTTAAGLWRYRLGDEVEVVGRYLGTPRVRFVGRVDGVSDLAGEKLSPGRVGEALAAAQGDLAPGLAPDFALVAPLPAPHPGEPPSYRLFVDAPRAADAQLDALGRDLEARLRAGHGYDLCRRLGQLGPLSVLRVERGLARYEAALVARGMRAGNVKPPSLHRGTFWGEVFAGAADSAGV